MRVKMYLKPNGRLEYAYITNINPEDSEWFTTNEVKVSMEELYQDQFAVYGDLGITDEDGESYELIVLSEGRSCEETLSELRKNCEEELTKLNQ